MPLMREATVRVAPEDTEIQKARPVERGDDAAHAGLRQALTSFTPFASLDAVTLNRLEAASDFRTYQNSETIYAAGDIDGTVIAIVCSGSVAFTNTDINSGELSVEVRGAGTMIGLEYLFAESLPVGLATVTLVARSETCVVFIDAEEMRSLALDNPECAQIVMTLLSQDLAELRLRNHNVSQNSEQLVFASLLGMVERDSVTGAWVISSLPKHRELGERANVDERVAAEAIATLLSAGIARRAYPNLVIEDMERLNRLAS